MAMFLVHTLNLPTMYGGALLTKLCELAPHVGLVFDTYRSPSIKDIELAGCGATDIEMTIT